MKNLSSPLNLTELLENRNTFESMKLNNIMLKGSKVETEIITSYLVAPGKSCNRMLVNY